MFLFFSFYMFLPSSEPYYPISKMEKKFFRGVLASRNYKNWATNSLPQEYFLAGTEATVTTDYLSRHLVSPDCIWLRSSSNPQKNDVKTFLQVHQKLTRPFTLVTTDGDNSFPRDSGFEALINNPLLVQWYTQNYDGPFGHPKVKPIPIGFDLHTIFDDSMPRGIECLARMLAIRSPVIKVGKSMTIYVDKMASSHPERAKVLQICKTIPAAYIAKSHVPRQDLFRAYGSHCFGVSPRGNGLDCHRTWEMLFFGMIPIIKRSTLDSLYVGLPVLLLDSYEELPGLDLPAKYKELSHLLPVPLDVFKISYWIK